MLFRSLSPPQQIQQSNKVDGTTNSTKMKHVIVVPSSNVVSERLEGDTFTGCATRRGDDVEYGNSNSNTSTHCRTEVRRNGNDTKDEIWCNNTVPRIVTDPDAKNNINDDGTWCPVEPDLAFRDALWDRAVWLVSLLILQSISGIILYKNEIVLSNHPSSTCNPLLLCCVIY